MRPHQSQLRDHFRESRLFINRAIFALVVILLLIVGLVLRLVHLQIVSQAHYQQLSEENRVKILPIPPTRGRIYDRNGALLADNLSSFTLSVVPEQVQNRDEMLRELGKLITLTPEDIDKFKKQIRRVRRFDAVPLRFHLTEEEVARFASNRFRFPGVDITADLIRHYPFPGTMAHIVGYVARISEDDQKVIDETDYAGSTHIGKSGIEKQYETLLHGKVGLRQVETNALGRELRVLEEQLAVAGENIYLSIDARLQQVTEQALEDNTGAVVALDPSNGEVLAMVSKPGYDPNPFVNGIDAKAYKALNTDKQRPLYNRALRGIYPPGSTIKPFMALAGMHFNAIAPHDHVFCPGFFRLPGQTHRYRCWRKSGHGSMNMDSAIVQSCDVYFYDLAHTLGIDRLHEFMTELGFGVPTEIDLPNESSGLYPSVEWKKKRRNEPWYGGETVIAGIGQGYVLTTPLQLASATATVASHGKRVAPRLLYARQPTETADLIVEPVRYRPPVKLNHPDQWEAAILPMINVVHSERGTAKRISTDITYQIAGKTGTAQVFGIGQSESYNEDNIPKELRDHALFVAFAPADAPKLALGIIVENGGHGGSVAAPIARKVFDAYFQLQELDP
jgi:penicillin-binding protein 2